VPGITTSLSAVLPAQLKMLTAASKIRIASGTRAANRRRFPCARAKTNVRAAKNTHILKSLIAVQGMPNGINRRKPVPGVVTLLAVVVTVRVFGVPAVTVVEVKVQVESGGQPARLKLTCPESGGASVLIVNTIVPPAVIVPALGDAAKPAGVGPLKLKTVLPPHSLTSEPAGGHNVVSKTETMM
jgi:hypothetical protein